MRWTRTGAASFSVLPDGHTFRRTGGVDARIDSCIARRSPLLLMTFSRIFETALRRDFHGVRLSRGGDAIDPATPRLVIYSNHPSWWDAMVYLLISRRLFPQRAAWAPIDAAMLEKYPFMARIGAFGVAQGRRAGSAFFLAFCRRVLSQADGLLMVTAEGGFRDARLRPVRLAPGLAHLAGHVQDATFVPLAIDYSFWNERQPELLLRFGKPVIANVLLPLPVAERNDRLALALETTMDALAREAIARDPRAFTTLLGGSAGIGGIYDLWRRGKAALRGRSFRSAHGEGP